MRTGNYSQEARARLAGAIVKAREAAGHRFRPSFAKAAGVGVRSIENVESLEPGAASVGESVLRAIGRALPTWTEETPRIILEGGPIPAGPQTPVSSAVETEELAPLDEVLSTDLDGLKTLARMYAWYEARKADREPNAADQERFMLWALRTRAARTEAGNIKPPAHDNSDIS